MTNHIAYTHITVYSYAIQTSLGPPVVAVRVWSLGLQFPHDFRFSAAESGSHFDVEGPYIEVCTTLSTVDTLRWF